MILPVWLEDGLDGQAKQPRDLERRRIVAIIAVAACGMLFSKGEYRSDIRQDFGSAP